MPDPLMTFDEVSAVLKVKPSTLRDWRLRRYGLDFVKCGRLVRVTRESLERYIRERTIAAHEDAQKGAVNG
jgi:excisionase family DNA binding protein